MTGVAAELYHIEQGVKPTPVKISKFHGAFVLNCRIDLHAIDAASARRRGGVVYHRSIR